MFCVRKKTKVHPQTQTMIMIGDWWKRKTSNSLISLQTKQIFMIKEEKKQLQRRIYTIPGIHGDYRPDNLASKVQILQIMELGETITRQCFERKDKKTKQGHIRQ